MNPFRFCLVVMTIAAGGAPASLAADATRGEQLYESRCFGCHAIDANRIGPMHRGVVGRKVGTAAGFAYSPALRDASVVWAGDTLDRWLTNPQAFIPGARMGFRVAEPADRADIIAYLKTQTAR
jgi:cytochrome c